MNEGRYIVRKKFDDSSAGPGSQAGSTTSEVSGEKTNFCIGVAGYPEHPEGFEKSIAYMKAKIDAGANYAITQMLFNSESYARFQKACSIPVLPGLHLLANAKQADFLKTHMLINVPDTVVRHVEDARWMQDWMVDLVEQFREAGAPGIHLFVITNADGTNKLLERLAKKYR
jgi:methylenetetrahydrofolate reductase (NADPH)